MMNSKGKKLKTYNKMILIRDIAKRCKRSQATVRQIYDALEDGVAVLLSSAKPNTDISLRLFEGITISSEHIPEKKQGQQPDWRNHCCSQQNQGQGEHYQELSGKVK